MLQVTHGSIRAQLHRDDGGRMPQVMRCTECGVKLFAARSRRVGLCGWHQTNHVHMPGDRCTACGHVVIGRGKRGMHRACYAKLYRPKCAACGEAVTDNPMKGMHWRCYLKAWRAARAAAGLPVRGKKHQVRVAVGEFIE